MKNLRISGLHHPDVIRYLGLHISKDGDTFMVMEYASKGSLKDFLRVEKNNLQMSDRFELMISTARGMQYLGKFDCLFIHVLKNPNKSFIGI